MFPLTRLVLLAAGWLLAASAPSAQAHGDAHELILNVTREIEKDPRNPELFLKRAELERAHSLWDAALADLERVAALTNSWPILPLARARLFLDAGWFESAKLFAEQFLARHPNHAEALLTRARAKAKLGERLSAAEDYTRAITNSATPGPELFIERAEMLVAEGGEHVAAALQGLEQGMSRLGPLVTLQLPAIEAELKLQRVDAALARLDKVMAQFPRKETWLARRGEILLAAGRTSEATEAFQAALKALDSLPPTRRAVPAMADLEQRIRASLAATGTSPSGHPPAPLR